jgi:alpha-L-rhamnosidase
LPRVSLGIVSGLLGLLMGLQGAAAADGNDPLREAFLSPPKSARPMLRWWWPGGDVTNKGIEQQIAAFDAAGFGGIEIEPFDIGLAHLTAQQRARVDDFATPAFFAHVAAAAKAAQQRGLFIDYTFGSGWPFGGGAVVTPELAEVELGVSRQTVTGPGPFPGKITAPAQPAGSSMMRALIPGARHDLSADWQRRLADRTQIVAVVAVKGSAAQTAPYPGGILSVPPQDPGRVTRPGVLEPNSPLVLTDRLRPDGTLDWSVPEGEWQLFVLRQFPSDLFILGGVGAGPQLVLDHFNKAAFAAHAGRVGESALPFLSPYIGKGWRGIFVDSVELPADAYWTVGFLEQFRRRRGYDLTPYLPLVFQPHWMNPYLSADAATPLYTMAGVGDRVIADYRLTVSELMQENFFVPFADWARQHGLQSRIQAHGSPTDLIGSYGLADIPEAEDMFAGLAPDFLKSARAAADLYGKQEVSAESFIFAGEALGVTPSMLKARADLLFTNGVNEIVGHGAAYPYEARAGTGWYPWGTWISSFLSPRNPIWPYLQPLTAYMTRLQAVLRTTENVVPVAIYRGTFGYQGIPLGQTAHEPTVNAALTRAGYDFDPVNADGLAKSRVEAGALVTPGGMHYQALVMPDVAALRAETAERIAAFAKAGLPVFFVGDVPNRDAGLKDFQVRDARVMAALQGILSPQMKLASATGLAAALQQRGILPNLTFLDGTSAAFIEKRSAQRRLFFLTNPDATSRRVSFRAAVQAGAAIWDAWSGTIRPYPTVRMEQGERVDLQLEPFASALVVLDPTQMPMRAAVPPGEPETILAVGERGWRFEAKGFGADGRAVSTSSRVLPRLEDWTATADLRDLAGEGRYTTTIGVGADRLRGASRLLLDLGELHDVGAVRVNGCPAVLLAIPPYRVDVTDALRVGTNSIEIDVADTPFNATRSPSTPPRPAGLLGPVVLRTTSGRLSSVPVACGHEAASRGELHDLTLR